MIWSALLACLFAVLALDAPAQAAETPKAQHVVVVGLSGLRWSDVSATKTPELWRLAGQGSVHFVDALPSVQMQRLGDSGQLILLLPNALEGRHRAVPSRDLPGVAICRVDPS